MKILDRIKQFIDEKGISPAEFYRATGLSNGYLDKVKNFGADKVESILKAYPRLNAYWLICGTPPMLLNNKENVLHEGRSGYGNESKRISELQTALKEKERTISDKERIIKMQDEEIARLKSQNDKSTSHTKHTATSI